MGAVGYQGMEIYFILLNVFLYVYYILYQHV